MVAGMGWMCVSMHACLSMCVLFCMKLHKNQFELSWKAVLYDIDKQTNSIVNYSDIRKRSL